MRKKRALCLVIVFVMLMTAACSTKKEEVISDDGTPTITYWAEFSGQAKFGVKTLAELPAYKNLMEETGVNIEYTHPVAGQVDEQLNLMIASGELPDIIEYPFYEYPGGPQKAVQDGCIITLNDVFKKYAPNMTAYLNENPEVAKMIRLDSGEYYTFPAIYDDESLLVFTGPIIRQDYLDKVGMERPETIEEWYNVLKAFRDELKISSPLSLSYANDYAFLQAFGVIRNLYVVDGKVKYGVVEPEFKKAVTELSKWYAEGLIDKNIATLDSKTVTYNMLNGLSGAAVGNTGGGIGSWMASMKDTPEFNVVATKYPVLNKGDMPMYGQRINSYSPLGSAAITTACKNVEAAARVLDYGYSEEGRMLFNFGIEGESYNLIDGYPKYSGLVTNNPNGTSLSQMVSYYTCPHGVGPFLRDGRYYEQIAGLPQQTESIQMWKQTDAKKHMLPPITLTTEESAQVAKIKSDLDTYIDAAYLKIITGVDSISEYDDFIAGVKALGVERYIDIYQEAYDRYESK